MKRLSISAMRLLTDAARQSNSTAASQLVKRTLAQQGFKLDNHLYEDSLFFGQAANKPNFYKSLSPLRSGNVHSRITTPEGAAFRSESYTSAQGNRNYQTYIPSTCANGITGLVVMLHGCTQNPDDFALGTQMNLLAEKHSFIVVYPHQSRGDNAQSCWNWFSPKDQRRDSGEPAIIAGITRLVMEEFAIPSEKAFVAGLSAGAAMAVILGRTYPDIYAAVGSHSGLPFGAAKNVQSAFAVMAGCAPDLADSTLQANSTRTIMFHGTLDSTVHPSNSDVIAQTALGKKQLQVLETVHKGQSAGRDYERRIVSSDDGTVLTEHWSIDGLGHAWSGGGSNGTFTDMAGPDASAEMVRFFFSENTLKI